jgi:glycosyltransferase involved in cell wall biosynthesis
MVHILIRTHERPQAFARCIESVISQTYKDVTLLVTTDTIRSYYYATDILKESSLTFEVIGQTPISTSKFFYNLHCNTLINHVTGDGWLFFLDDDDFLASNNAIEDISKEFVHNQAIICQMLRNDRPKPSAKMMDERDVRSGYIGMPCIVLPTRLKNANFTDQENADYQWISQYIANARFVKKVLVNSKERGHGKPE